MKHNQTLTAFFQRLCRGGVIPAILVFVATAARAEDNTSLIITGPTTTNIGGSLTIGSSGTNNSLQIYNAGSVTNTNGTIGNGTAADWNYVLVQDANSLWQNNGTLYLGYQGDNNSLIVTNGGRVNNTGASYFGYFNAGSSNNVAIVTGAGSVWSNGAFMIMGNNGNGNRLTISDGGRVDVAQYVQMGWSDNNTVLVTGSNSLWNVISSFEVGLTGKNNLLKIANGGQVLSPDSYVSYVYAAGQSNSVVVTDPGSVWSNTSILYFGHTGNGNSMTITNGGRVYDTQGYVGYNASASNNTILVAGTNSLWNNSSTMYLGYTAGGNNLTILDGGRVNAAGSWTIVSYIGASNGSNSVLVSGAGSTWSNTSYMIFGDTGNNNSMVISNGGRVDVNYILAGYSDNNSILITDTNSLLSMPASSMELGMGGHNNRATVANGAAIVSYDGYIGNGTGGSNDVLTVTGAGSVWTNASTLYVGYSGTTGERLVVTNGGKVYAGTGYMSGVSSSSNNTVIVTDNGSLWQNGGTLYVGYRGGGNQLIITNGAVVKNGTAWVGETGGSAANNRVTVTGTGSVWSNTGDIYLGGGSGGNNQLVVPDGGRVVAGQLFQGYTSSANPGNNSILITGSNSLVNLTGYYEPVYGTNNQLTILNGGRMNDTVGYVGGGVSGSNTIVTVSGSGSVWSNSSLLYVGYVSKGNRLTISNSGRVDNTAAYIGGYGTPVPDAGNNTVLVTDPGTVWNNKDIMYLGSYSSGNQMIVSNGAYVINVSAPSGSSAWIGYVGGSGSNNLATVTGAGSVWTNVGGINIGGSYGYHNGLRITDGGRVDAAFSYMGYTGLSQGSDYLEIIGPGSQLNLGSFFENVYGPNDRVTISNGGRMNYTIGYLSGTAGNSNSVFTVTGAGSIMSNTSTLYLGYAGASNILTVSDGAQAHNATAIIGNAAAASNNVIVVTGTNSLWNNTAYVSIGRFSAGNQVIVSNGAVVNAKDTWIGADGFTGNAGASGNSLTITGAGSQWTNNGTIYGYGFVLGALAPSNRLTIADGGRLDTIYGFVGYYGAPQGWAANNNTVLVTGSNSLWNVANYLELGLNGYGNTMVISNGGRVVNGTQGYVGVGIASSNNTVVITGAGSLWQNGGALYFGSNTAGNTFGINGRIMVNDGGTLDAPSLIGGYLGSGSISNVAGIYQFPLFNPTITPNTAGSIMITNGTISFRGIANADVFSDVNGTLTNIAFRGNNTFRLNSSSNRSDIAQSYTFDTGRGATNYVGLELVNGNTAWRSANLTIGSGGRLLASNTTASVAAIVNSTGSIQVVNSKITYASNVVINSSYVSDPSTNTFMADVTVNQPGFMAGGTGDLFDFKKSFLIHATNSTSFNLISSTVEFSGGGVHTNLITGLDYGTNGVYGGNYEYGTLRLGSSSDTVCFGCGNIPAIASNALYVGWLDLNNDTNMVANLRAPSTVNLYYFIADSRNSYLNGQTYQLLDCNGGVGGLLMAAIPEPTTAALLLTAGALLLRRRNA